jgi:hypothetical protein
MRLFIETDIRLDPVPIEANHPDVDAVERGEFVVCEVVARVVDLDTLKEGRGSLSGIVVSSEDDPYLTHCLSNELTEALASVGLEVV